MTQNAMLQNILKIKPNDKIRIADVLNETKAKQVGVTVKNLKFVFAGRIARESNFKWNKILTYYKPLGKRKRGTLATRWVDKLGWVAS